MSKIISNLEPIVAQVKDGDTLMLGGFGLSGLPEYSIDALLKSGVKNLTCISNNAGVDDFGIGLMLKTRPLNLHVPLQHAMQPQEKKRQRGSKGR